MPKASPYVTALQRSARKLLTVKPEKAHPLLYEAFKVAALAGEADSAKALLTALYALPPAKGVVTALSTHAIDVYAQAAGLGDVTGGKPTFAYSLVTEGDLSERVAAIDQAVRERVSYSAYAGPDPTDDAWRALPRTDPWFAIGRYRRIQQLVTPGDTSSERESEALARLTELLADWPATERGPGGGHELVMALDLAFRQGAVQQAEAWLTQHGHRIGTDLLVDTLLCFPAIAAQVVAGFFRPLAVVEASQLAAVRREADALVSRAGKAAPAAKVPKVQKRSVSTLYSQVHLEPASPTAAELKQVHFQDPREHAQAMSLFPTMVGLAAPSETEQLTIEVVLEPKAIGGAPDLDGAVQAVTFPLAVRDGVRLRGVGDDGAEPVNVPNGQYDVLAVFSAQKIDQRSQLRTFTLRLSFRPAGSLGAPACLRLEQGAPPAEVFVAGRP